MCAGVCRCVQCSLNYPCRVVQDYKLHAQLYFIFYILFDVFFLVCEYYTHAECKDFVVSNCKQCATYTPHIDQVNYPQPIPPPLPLTFPAKKTSEHLRS